MATGDNFAREIRVGDRLALDYGVRKDKTLYSLDHQAGRPAVAVAVGALASPAVMQLLSAFERRAGEFKLRDADILVFIDATAPHAIDYESAPNAPLEFIYCLPRTFKEWGWDGAQPLVFIIDRNARVISSANAGAPDDVAQSALEYIPAGGASDEAQQPAPVLLIPNVFSASFCGELIEHFENNPHVKGGIASMDANGAAYNRIDDAKKKREDFILSAEDRLFAPVVETLSRTCAPEIRRAFQFDAAYTDRIVLARYDADGGCFLRHRDNAAPGVAYRQFAVSINLNAEEYEGGHLLFPEYSSCRYKAPTGAAVVFSATLLHEATHVLKGRRYVLLTFFHNTEAEARRLAAA